MAADPAVYNVAYGVAKSKGVSSKVLLSLFETGIVESGFKNDLVATDHDSLGYLQQRPSAGWPNPTNVTTATNSYLAKAVKYAAAHPNATAGQIAQAVQVSAFPARYDEAQSQAVALLAKIDPQIAAAAATAAGTKAGDLLDDATDAAADAAGGILSITGLTQLVAAATGVLTTLGGIFTSLVPVATTITKLFLPSNLVRLAMGVFGFVFLGASIWFLGRELTA